MLKKDHTAPHGYRAPRAGEVMRMPQLAKTLRTLAAEGKKGFYEGRIGNEIIKVVSKLGGYLSPDDLKHHCKVERGLSEPISLCFRGQGITETYKHGLHVWEHPPNGQGLVALMALGLLEEMEKLGLIQRFDRSEHNSVE